MSDRKIKRALIAVYDKTGIVDFARALVDEFGIEIISTGGTAKHLKDAGISVTMVEQVTGFPEMLDGRVKTLHPKIHAGILADRDNPDHMRQLKEQGIEPIDMVVVNLYPFEKTVADPNCTFEQAIEMIDIGGPCMLRAAAKNHRHVVVVGSQNSYVEALGWIANGSPEVPGGDPRLRWAANSFFGISQYDAQVSEWLSGCLSSSTAWPSFSAIFASNWGGLRYGENPHQKSELWQITPDDSDSGEHDLTIADAQFCDSQPALSHNNFIDADAALGLCSELARATEVWHRILAGATPHGHGTPREFDSGRESVARRAVISANGKASVCLFIKHTNACGVGIGGDPIDAYRQAYLGDPNAAMGGILACNFEIDAAFAATVMETFDRFGKPLKEAGHPAAPGGFFVEVWLAPKFTDEAIKIIRGTAEPSDDRPVPPKKKWGENVRLLAVGDMMAAPDPNEMDYKRIAGGMLVQTRDLLGLNEDEWKVVTKRSPTESEMSDLRLAWLIAKHTKSNAIGICKDGMLIGNGAGQMSRVMSCRIATWLAKENGHAGKLAGSAAASDAFFPFRDGPEILIDAGVTALIQPGGSKRDEEVIAACDERGVAMIFTGTRHFKH